MQSLSKGPLTSSVLALERMLAESPAFRRRVAGEAEASDQKAREHIFLFYLRHDDPRFLSGLRPFALVAPADEVDLEQYAGGQQNYLKAGGQLLLILTDNERVPDPRLDGRLSGLDFCGWCDEILKDIKAMAGRDTYLPVRQVSLMQKPVRVDRKDEPSAGRYWDAAFLVSW